MENVLSYSDRKLIQNFLLKKYNREFNSIKHNAKNIVELLE